MRSRISRKASSRVFHTFRFTNPLFSGVPDTLSCTKRLKPSCSSIRLSANPLKKLHPLSSWKFPVYWLLTPKIRNYFRIVRISDRFGIWINPHYWNYIDYEFYHSITVNFYRSERNNNMAHNYRIREIPEIEIGADRNSVERTNPQSICSLSSAPNSPWTVFSP